MYLKSQLLNTKQVYYSKLSRPNRMQDHIQPGKRSKPFYLYQRIEELAGNYFSHHEVFI